MDKHILHTRLAALAIGVGLAACAIALVCLLFPAQSETRPGVDYGYVYSGVKSSSVEFVEAAMTEESLMVLGSSELSTPRRLVPQVPVQVFGKADYGVRLMLIGEAFDQSLWHAIALGAYQDAGIPRNKVVLIVTPGWFVDGGQDSDTFKTRFSYSLYSRFNANANVPEEAKSYVLNRLKQLGIDETTISSANPSLPQDYLNAFALKALDDLKLRAGWGINGNQGGIGNYSYLAHHERLGSGRRVLYRATRARPRRCRGEQSWRDVYQHARIR